MGQIWACYCACNASQTCWESSCIASGVFWTNIANRNVINSDFVCAHSSAVMFGFCSNFMFRSFSVSSCPTGELRTFLSASETMLIKSSKFFAIIISSPFFLGGSCAARVLFNQASIPLILGTASATLRKPLRLPGRNASFQFASGNHQPSVLPAG